MLDFIRKKRKKGIREEEAVIEVALGVWSGYSNEDDLDSDPWDSKPEMIKGKTVTIK